MSINTLLAAVLLLDFMILAASRVARCIQLAAFQGVLLALVLLAMHESWPLHVLLMAFTTAAIKGAVIPFLLARAVLPEMLARGFGRIVNVASISATIWASAPSFISSSIAPPTPETVRARQEQIRNTMIRSDCG